MNLHGISTSADKHTNTNDMTRCIPTGCHANLPEGSRKYSLINWSIKLILRNIAAIGNNYYAKNVAICDCQLPCQATLQCCVTGDGIHVCRSSQTSCHVACMTVGTTSHLAIQKYSTVVPRKSCNSLTVAPDTLFRQILRPLTKACLRSTSDMWRNKAILAEGLAHACQSEVACR
jgi:hypothetical protein